MRLVLTVNKLDYLLLHWKQYTSFIKLCKYEYKMDSLEALLRIHLID